MYVGNNKHYAAVFTGLRNAWSDGPTMEFLGERTAWEEEAKKKRDASYVEMTVERIARAKSPVKLKFHTWPDEGTVPF
jgi:hypothetical protein